MGIFEVKLAHCPLNFAYIHIYITICIARCVDSTEYLLNQRRWRQSLGGQLLASKVISFQVALKLSSEGDCLTASGRPFQILGVE